MSSPDNNPTHHFTCSAAAGGLQTTNLKTMPKNSDKSTETSSDPLKPHVVEEEAFKAAYKAGNTDYNDNAAFKAQEKRSVKRKLKKAIGKVKNKVGHEDKSDQSSDEDYDLDGTIKRTESGKHLSLVKTSINEDSENDDGKKESNNGSLLKKKANKNDESKSANASSTNLTEHQKTESLGNIEKDEIKTKENNLTGSKNSKKDDQRRPLSFESQKVNTIDREKESAKSVKIDSKEKPANEDKKNKDSNTGNFINSSQTAQIPNISATAKSSQTKSFKPDVPRDNHHEEEHQKGMPNYNSTNSSENKNGIAERIYSTGNTVYEALFGSTSNDASDNSSTSNIKSTDDYENLGDISEGPSGTTYRKKFPGDIISLKSSSSEKLDADAQIGRTTDTSLLPSGAPTSSKILFQQELNQKRSNVPNVQESGVTNISKINKKDSSIQNDLNSANKLNEAVGEMSVIHTKISDPSLKNSSKGIDTTSASIQPIKDDICLQTDDLTNRNLQTTSSGPFDSNSSAQDSKLVPGAHVLHSYRVDTKKNENLSLPDKSIVATAGNTNHSDPSSSEYLVASAGAGAFAKAPITESAAKPDALTNKDGKKVTHDELINNEKASTHNKSFIPTSLGIPSDSKTQITKDPSLLAPNGSNMKPNDHRIAKTAILPLNEDQLKGVTKANNELSASSSNAEEGKTHKVSSPSSSRAPRSSPTISVESQSNRQPIFEEEAKSKFQEPFEYPFSNAQNTDIFDSSGNPPQAGAVKGIASFPIASKQGDQRIPRSGGVTNAFDLGSSNASKKSHENETSTSSVTSKNSFAMIAELQGLAQQSYYSHK